MYSKLKNTFLRETLPDDFEALVARELWQRDRENATILALRRSGCFPCSSYLEANPDVQGIDPIDHYVRYGFDEGRQIVSNKYTIAKTTEHKKLFEEIQEENALLFEYIQSFHKRIDEDTTSME